MPYPTLSTKVTRTEPGRYKVEIIFNGETAPVVEIQRQNCVWVVVGDPKVTSKTKQGLVYVLQTQYVTHKYQTLRQTPNPCTACQPRKSLALTPEQANDLFDVLVAEWEAKPEDRAAFLLGFQSSTPIADWLCAPGRRWRQSYSHFAVTFDAYDGHNPLVVYQATMAGLALENLYAKFFGGSDGKH